MFQPNQPTIKNKVQTWSRDLTVALLPFIDSSGMYSPHEIETDGDLLTLDCVWGMNLGREIEPEEVRQGNVRGVRWMHKNIYSFEVKRRAGSISDYMDDFVFAITPRSHRVYQVMATSRSLTRRDAEDLRERLRVIYMRDASPHSFEVLQDGNVTIHSNISDCEVSVSVERCGSRTGMWMVLVRGTNRKMLARYNEESNICKCRMTL